MTISLIHPSRSRATKAWETFSKWEDYKGIVRLEHILSIDTNDKQVNDYKYLFEKSPCTKILISDNRSAVDAINNAAKVSTGDILIVMSDDFDCPMNWGGRIVDTTSQKTDWIAKTPDGIQKWIITLPIMDRHYYNRFGYIYYPEFLHMFCDTFLTCVADLTGRKIELNIPFVHNHYSTGKTQKDEVSIRADATWDQGEKLFLELARKNFMLKPEDIKGSIKSQEYLNWIKNRL